MIKAYDDVVDHTSKLQVPTDLAEIWKQDHAEACRIISVGREVSKAEVERLLAYHKSKPSGKEGWRRKNFEKDKHLQQMLKMGQEGNDAKERCNGPKKIRGWGRVAHSVEKGMRALAKALPDEMA